MQKATPRILNYRKEYPAIGSPNNSSNGGVSKKISNPLDRKRLKKLHDGFNLPDGMSIIIRTNAISAEDEDIIADFNYLRKFNQTYLKLMQ